MLFPEVFFVYTNCKRTESRLLTFLGTQYQFEQVRNGVDMDYIILTSDSL